MKTVGFIGTGGMGSRMAKNVMAAGFDLVVNDSRREATTLLAGRDGFPLTEGVALDPA